MCARIAALVCGANFQLVEISIMQALLVWIGPIVPSMKSGLQFERTTVMFVSVAGDLKLKPAIAVSPGELSREQKQEIFAGT